VASPPIFLLVFFMGDFPISDVQDFQSQWDLGTGCTLLSLLRFFFSKLSRVTGFLSRCLYRRFLPLSHPPSGFFLSRSIPPFDQAYMDTLFLTFYVGTGRGLFIPPVCIRNFLSGRILPALLPAWDP